MKKENQKACMKMNNSKLDLIIFNKKAPMGVNFTQVVKKRIKCLILIHQTNFSSNRFKVNNNFLQLLDMRDANNLMKILMNILDAQMKNIKVNYQ